MRPEPISQIELRQAIVSAVEILRHNLPEFTHYFQSSNSQNNMYLPSENVEWTTGFCTGEYWIAWELTADESFRDAALVQVDSFLDRIERHIDVDHHDMGFLYTPSCVAAYKLTGSETGKKAALAAADHLMSRFQEKGQFFQAWGSLNAPENYRLIIDCLMNLPLLYWASETTGDQIYREKALAHTKTSLQNLVRSDNSTYHTYFFDPETGNPLRGVTHQGYRDGSAWARGQAWGIYGLAISYAYTKDESCIDLFHKVCERFLANCSKDMVPYWDLDFTEQDGEPKDSSAAAIAVCGMLEMIKYLPKAEAEYYMDAACRITGSLARNYAVTSSDISNGLLLHGVYAKSSPYNPVQDRGVDECNTWGDYFWMETLIRLTTDWRSYW